MTPGDYLFTTCFLLLSLPVPGGGRGAELVVPAHVYAVLGEGERRATLECEMLGFSPVPAGHDWQILWEREGHPFSLITNYIGNVYNHNALTHKYEFRNTSEGSGQCSMHINNFTRADQGNYSVTVQYQQQITRHTFLHVVDPAPPESCSISSDVGDSQGSVAEGSPGGITLTCTIAGAFPFAQAAWIQTAAAQPRREIDAGWRRFTRTRVPPDNAAAASNRFQLTIAPVTRADAGRYTCEASNSKGSVACTYTLHVQSAPEVRFRVDKGSSHVGVGDTVRLECEDTAQAHPVPTLLIKRDGWSVNMESAVQHHVATLISPVRREDAGLYWCVGSNPVAETNQSVTLNVQYVRCWLDLGPLAGARKDSGGGGGGGGVNDNSGSGSGGHSSVVVAENDTVSVACLSDSNPAAQMWWEDEHGSVLNQTTSASRLPLVLPTITHALSGVYKCVTSVRLHDTQVKTSNCSVRVTVRKAPRIVGVTPGEEVTVREGESVELECTYTDGVPPARARWVSAATNASLQFRHGAAPHAATAGGGGLSSIVTTLHDIQRHNRGQYLCRVNNSVGEASVRSVQLHVIFPPDLHLKVSPFPIAIEGENRTFHCIDSARSFPVPRLALLLEERQLHAVLGHRLDHTIKMLKEHSGLYRCVATTSGRSPPVHTQPVRVNVQYFPQISVNVETEELEEGEQVRATCTVVANPLPSTLFWVRPSGQRIPVALTQVGGGKQHQQARLVRLHEHPWPASKADSGEWQCVAANTFHNGLNSPTTHANFSVSVLYAPSELALSPSASFSVREGSDEGATIRCSFRDGNPPCSFKWTVTHLGSTETEALRGSEEAGAEKERRTSAIHISKPSEHDSGRYCCAAVSSRFAQISNCVNMAVQFGPSTPQLTLLSSPMPAVLPHDARIQCVVERAQPAAQVLWLLDGEALDQPRNQVHHTVTQTDSSFRTQSVLTLPLRTSDHGKHVWCAATQPPTADLDGRGHVISQKQQLAVHYEPDITALPRVFAALGGPIQLSCTVTARPAPSVSWLQNGNELTSHHQGIQIERMNISDERTESRLNISKVTSFDDKYTCVAVNELGTAEGHVFIQEPEPPMLAPPLRAQNTGNGLLNISWESTRSEDGSSVWYRVWYDTEERNDMGAALPTRTHLQRNFTQSHVSLDELREARHTLFVQACNHAGCSQPVSTIVNMERDGKASSQLVAGRGGLGVGNSSMTILEVTLSLVVFALAVALAYLIVVLVICVKKIRLLEDLSLPGSVGGGGAVHPPTSRGSDVFCKPGGGVQNTMAVAGHNHMGYVTSVASSPHSRTNYLKESHA